MEARSRALSRLLHSGGYTMRDTITLACQACKQRNYTTSKNKKTVPQKLELKKYCPFCKSHTAHKETK